MSCERGSVPAGSAKNGDFLEELNEGYLTMSYVFSVNHFRLIDNKR